MSLQQPRIFSLFDVEINNDSMSEAVERVFQNSEAGRTQTVCFVNVNTLNLAVTNKALISAVNDADYVFADGAGVRIASKRQGVKLRDNVNGTDMLPLLCERAEQEAKSVFLLGAKPGVAYLYWPALLWLGISLNPLKSSQITRSAEGVTV